MHFLLNIVHTHTYLLLKMLSSVLCRWSPWRTSCDANILPQISLPPGHLLRGHNTSMLARSSGIGRQLKGQELSIRLKLQPGSSASNLLIFSWWSVSELYDFFEQDSISFISNSNSFNSNCPRKGRGKDEFLQNSAEQISAEFGGIRRNSAVQKTCKTAPNYFLADKPVQYHACKFPLSRAWCIHDCSPFNMWNTPNRLGTSKASVNDKYEFIFII